MKIVFMGTPEFAAAALDALIRAGHEITAVVTQPDKPKGRGRQLMAPPVKELALLHNIPVLQPVKIKRPEEIAVLKQYEADVYVVAAFGQILSQEILDIPRYGCLNIHASLLPAYRGAAPIQWCILRGEKKTGVTIMQMDAGLDTGDMLTKAEVPILDTDTAESLEEKLMQAGADLICRTLPLVEQGKLQPEKQGECPFYAKLLDKSMGQVQFASRSAEEIDLLIRGLYPWPTAYCSFRGKNMKLLAGRVLPEAPAGSAPGNAGQICAVDKNSITVTCREGFLQITRLQPEGKKAMDVKDFLLGNAVKPGDMLE
ncbi:MAG: methionyl-tRNA formyltransferase [Lachnospiraceae bacterium]|nr:methionyl-tRNA formyltransferase [Lachnospiraceae bacterium]